MIIKTIQIGNKTKAHISYVYFPRSHNLVGFNIILLRGVCALDCSVMSNSLQPYGSYVACKAPLSIGFLRQEYWSGLPFPPPGDLQTQGSNLCLLHCREIIYCSATGEAHCLEV